MQLSSSERRMDRYRILYMYKILKGAAPNIGLTSLPPTLRRGRMLTVPSIHGSRVHIKTLRETWLMTEGPRLFNSLPRAIRDLNVSIETFKAHLDNFLSTIQDIPYGNSSETPDASCLRNYPSNSIRHWTQLLNTKDWTITAPVVIV